LTLIIRLLISSFVFSGFSRGFNPRLRSSTSCSLSAAIGHYTSKISYKAFDGT
jgi:uncharacterized membrane protein YjjB (DUF3815 family)